LRRLRQALYLKLRDEIPVDREAGRRPEWLTAVGVDGRLRLGRKDPRFWPAVGIALDVLQAVEARVGDAAERLGVSTANLVEFLRTDDKVWEQANQLRSRFGQKPLR
jgi:hypothetical protein